MLNVSNETKTAWGRDSSDKEFLITVEGIGSIGNSNIRQNSFNFTESIMSSDSLEFVGCIARRCEFTTNAFNDVNLKNKRITVKVRANKTEWIQVFKGVIDESKKESMKGLKRITAYDDFYRLSQMDASAWWNALPYTSLMGSFLNFCTAFSVGYNVSKVSFVNSTIPCFGGSKRQAKKLTALGFLAQLCQINGCMGYIDGEGKFSVRYIDAPMQTAYYPAESLFPSAFIYPSDYSGGSGEVTPLPYYQSLEYEDYSVHEIDKVTIRNSSEDVGVSYPYAGENTYIIQGNIFAYDQSGTTLLNMASAIHNVVSHVGYRPFVAKNMAMPWIECGDVLMYYDIDDNGNSIEVTLLLLTRQMSGDQMMWDTFSAEGEQDQRIFITDLQAQIEDLQKQIEDMSGDTPDGALSGIILTEQVSMIEANTLGGIEEAYHDIVDEEQVSTMVNTTMSALDNGVSGIVEV